MVTKWRTNEAQFEYFADEAEGKIAGGTAVPGWKTVKDLAGAGQIGHAYEGFGDNSTGTRIGNARKWLRAYEESHAAAKSPAAADAAKSSAAPAARAKPEHMSMNNLDHWQGAALPKFALRVFNDAGANYAVASGMLGAGSGNFGTT